MGKVVGSGEEVAETGVGGGGGDALLGAARDDGGDIGMTSPRGAEEVDDGGRGGGVAPTTDLSRGVIGGRVAPSVETQ